MALRAPADGRLAFESLESRTLLVLDALADDLGALPELPPIDILPDVAVDVGLEAAPPVAPAAPVASALTLDLWANYNTLGVRLSYTEDVAYIGTKVEGTLQISTDGVLWVDGHDFVKDVTDRMLVSKLFGLSEGQTYNIRATFIRRNALNVVLEQQTVTQLGVTMQTTPEPGTNYKIWISPNGNDANLGTFNAPKRTIAAASAVMPAAGGAFLMLKDGDYFFDAALSEQSVWSMSGGPGRYNTIMAEHPGQARILGYRTINGPWTSYGSGIYWTSAPQLYFANEYGQFGPNRVTDATRDQVLYTYGSLTTDSAPIFAMTRHSEPGWFYDLNTRRLYVKLASGAAPAPGQIRASNQTSGLSFANSSYWIVDGIQFEQFGRSFKPVTVPGNTYGGYTAYAIGIYGGDNIVVRNSTFRHAGLVVHDNTVHAPNNILIENNTFYTNGMWDVFYEESFENSQWERIKSTPLETFAIQALHVGRGMVIRNNTFDGFATAVMMASESAIYVADVDIHNNISYRHADDLYEADSTGTDGGNINTAIFNNTSYGALIFVSASSFKRGPLWVIGNYAEDNLVGPIKSGQQRAADSFTNSTGWKLIYNNTFASDVPGSGVYGSNAGQGNTIAKNNIFAGTTHLLLAEVSDVGAHRAPVLFDSNVFYSSDPAPQWWAWETREYQTLEAMDAAAVMLEMKNTIHTVNPFPSGIGGPLNSALATWGISIKGITNVIIPMRMPCGGGDLNGNGVVDYGDLAVLVRSLGQQTGSLVGDLNSDNRVGLADMALLQRFQGQACGLPASSPPPPAPSPSADKAADSDHAPEVLKAAASPKSPISPTAVDAVISKPLTVGSIHRGSRTVWRHDVENLLAE
jgi:hypothetical protein